MFRLASHRTFATSARFLEEKTLTQKAAEAAKAVAGAFKSDGKVGEKFNADGAIGGTAQKVGGPFSADGTVGKQFTKDGAIGGTGEAVAKKGQKKAEEAKH